MSIATHFELNRLFSSFAITRPKNLLPPTGEKSEVKSNGVNRQRYDEHTQRDTPHTQTGFCKRGIARAGHSAIPVGRKQGKAQHETGKNKKRNFVFRDPYQLRYGTNNARHDSACANRDKQGRQGAADYRTDRTEQRQRMQDTVSQVHYFDRSMLTTE
jgi:hypothetical protein